jgi:hypothetical protein
MLRHLADAPSLVATMFPLHTVVGEVFYFSHRRPTKRYGRQDAQAELGSDGLRNREGEKRGYRAGNSSHVFLPRVTLVAPKAHRRPRERASATGARTDAITMEATVHRSIRIPIKAMLAAFVAALSLMMLHAASNAAPASASACSLGDLSCYHEITGVRFGTTAKCYAYAIGHGYAPSASWVRCVTEQPSGWVSVYVFSFRCQRNQTYQWCVAHKEQ